MAYCEKCGKQYLSEQRHRCSPLLATLGTGSESATGPAQYPTSPPAREHSGEPWSRELVKAIAEDIGKDTIRLYRGHVSRRDQGSVYRGLGGLFFNHETVNHSEGEYVRDDVTTNGVESVFAVMKRGLIGVYHHASKKHLGRYVDEFAFRLNEGDVKRHTMQRLDSFIDGVAGKRLTYKALIN